VQFDPIPEWVRGLVVWHPPHTLKTTLVLLFNKSVMKFCIMDMSMSFILYEAQIHAY